MAPWSCTWRTAYRPWAALRPPRDNQPGSLLVDAPCRVDGKLTPVATGDMCFAAAHAEHGFENFTDDFAIWIIFYGPVK